MKEWMLRVLGLVSLQAGTRLVGLTLAAGLFVSAAGCDYLAPALNDFGILVSPQSQSVPSGTTSTSFNLTVSPAGRFSGPVDLSATGIPSGVSAMFMGPVNGAFNIDETNPQPETGKMFVNGPALSPIPDGVLTITITGKSGTIVHSVTVQLTVGNPGPTPTPTPSPTPTPTPSQAGLAVVISENSQSIVSDGGANPIIALSGNGRYAAFENQGAKNLVTDPTVSQAIDVYFHDSCAGASGCPILTRLASAINGFSGNGGNDGNGPSVDQPAQRGVSISGDGRFVLFLSHATNLTTPSAQFEQAYIRDTCTGAAAGCTPSTQMISLADSGGEPNGAASDVSISANGGFVAFISAGTNLVASTNAIPAGEAYLRNTDSHCAPTSCTVLVSLDSGGNPANAPIQDIAVSGTGRFVIFQTAATNLGAPAGKPEIFVRDTCNNAPPTPVCTPSTAMVSVDNNGIPAPTGALAASISDDGRFIAFTSTDQLAPQSLPLPANNLYVRDTCQTESGPVASCPGQSTTTVSVAADGTAGNFGVQTFLIASHVLSGDGGLVVFDSNATNLVPGGTSGGGVFVRKTCIGAANGCTPTTVLVSVDASGNFVQGSRPVISSDGHYCAFMVISATSLQFPQEQAVLCRTGF